MKRLAIFGLISTLYACSSSSEPSAFNQGNGLSFLKIAEHMRQSGDYGSARNFYMQALQQDTDNVNARFGLAATHAALGYYTQAEKDLNRLLKDNPSMNEYQLALAKVYMAQGKTQDAQPILVNLQKNEADNPMVLNLQGVLYDSEGQHQKAQEMYLMVLEKHPDNPQILSNLGLSKALAGDYPESLEILESIATQPNATSRDRHNLALAYALSGDMSSAERVFRKDLSDVDTKRNIAYLANLRRDEVTPSEPIMSEDLDIGISSIQQEPLP